MKFIDKIVDAFKKISDIFKRFIELFKRNNIVKVSVALGLAGILTLTLCLAFCNNCKGNGGGDYSPTAGYRIVNDYNGKTAEQIYAEALATSNQNNFSYSVDYDIIQVVSLGAQGTNTHNQWFHKILKKADNDIHYETINNKGRLATGEDKGRFVKKQTLVSGINYNYSATLYTQGYTQITHDKKETKAQCTYGQFFKNLGTTENSLLNPLYNFVSEDFKDVKIYVNKLDSSDIYFTLSIKGDNAKTFTKDLLQQAEMIEATPTSNTEVTCVILLTDDGKFEKAQVSFKIQEGSSPHTFVYSFKGEIAFSNIGSTIVSAPENANEYVES